MRRVAFVGLAFVLNLVLGNVCLLGTVYAATPVHSDATMLSREIPMSFNIVTCTWVKTDDGWQPTEGSPCASGRCVKKSEPETSCMSTPVTQTMAAELPINPIETSVTKSNSPTITTPTESPPPFPGLGSVVLRM